MQNNFWDDYLQGRTSKSWFPFSDYDQYIHGNILDLGCGEGDLIAQLMGKGNLYGVDLAEETINIAQRKFPVGDFRVGDVCDLSYFESNFFDFIFSSDVIEHVPEYEKMVAEAARLIKPGGVVLIKTPNYPIKRFYDFVAFARKKKSFADDPTHCPKLHYFTIKKVLEKYFDDVSIGVRNIMGEEKFKILKKFKKDNFFGNLVGQKFMVVCKKKKV